MKDKRQHAWPPLSFCRGTVVRREDRDEESVVKSFLHAWSQVPNGSSCLTSIGLPLFLQKP